MKAHHADRLWNKYIEKTKTNNIPIKSIRWYVKRVEDHLRTYSNVSITQHSPTQIESYLQDLGRNSRLQDWQFQQTVDALRIFFVDLIGSHWAANFPWSFWIASSKQLPNSHATVARDYLPVVNKDSINSRQL